MTDDDYTPFGPEWERLLMSTRKKFIIDRLREACLRESRIGEDRVKLSTLINFVNQEMGNTVEWTGDHWQWKK